MKIAMTSANQPVALNEDGTWQLLKPSASAMQKLQAAEQQPEILDFFKKLFERIGVEIVDSDERFTCVHHGDKIEFEDGIDEGLVDFCVRVYAYQIDRFLAALREGYTEPLARFRLVREIFRSSYQAGNSFFNNPVSTNPAFRKIINAKNLLHVHLLSPNKDEEQDATFTFFFVNGGWNLAQGLVGEPERTFRLSADEAIALHSHVLSATRGSTLIEFPKLAKWYIDWRARVEDKAA